MGSWVWRLRGSGMGEDHGTLGVITSRRTCMTRATLGMLVKGTPRMREAHVSMRPWRLGPPQTRPYRYP